MEINKDNCIQYLRERYPSLDPYWNDHIATWGENIGLTIHLWPFSDYVADVTRSKNDMMLKKIFADVEFLITQGDADVKNAIATSFLESLLSMSENQQELQIFIKYLGKESLAYCKAWNDFTGVSNDYVDEIIAQINGDMHS